MGGGREDVVIIVGYRGSLAISDTFSLSILFPCHLPVHLFPHVSLVLGPLLAGVVWYLFHHPHHQRTEKVKFKAENVFLLPGASSGRGQ